MPNTPITDRLDIDLPLFCGAMFPCSNPELVAAASKAGALGIVQPISLTYIHGYDFREGLRKIRRITDRPIGLNVLVDKSSKVYEARMRKWVDVAVEEGVRFFVTALGNPRWVVERVRDVDGVVFHDVPSRRFAERALEGGVHGLICVNTDAGGHCGTKTPKEMFDELHDLDVPLVCAGGVGEPAGFVEALEMGYAAVQMGTRFIATEECSAHDDYKRAILDATEDDIVYTERVSGIPVSVINTPYVQQLGTSAGPLAKRLLKNPRTKHMMRAVFQVQSAWKMKRVVHKGSRYAGLYQAGRSVGGVSEIEPVADVVKRFKDAYDAMSATPRTG